MSNTRMTIGGRRAPLGQLSLSTTNSRQSFMTPRMSIAKTSRPSTISRRSTISKNKQQKYDPRPIQNKSFQLNCCKKILEFLVSSCTLDQKLDTKVLMSPMTREFGQILESIMCQLDPNFTLAPPQIKNGKNSKKHIPLFDPVMVVELFALLGYPFPLNPSKLQTIAPHSWPPFLAALAWLVELVQYYNQTCRNDDDDDGFRGDSEDQDTKLFFKFLVKAYADFVRGEDSYSTVDKEMEAYFGDKNKKAMQEIEKLVQEMNEAQEEVKIYETTDPPLVTLEKRKRDFAIDTDKLKELVKMREDGREQLLKIIAAEEQQQMNIASNTKQLEREKEILQKQIDSQKLSAIDVIKLNNTRQKLEETLSELIQTKEKLLETSWKLDSDRDELKENVTKLIKEFNQFASKLQLIPETANNANGFNFSLDITQKAADIVPIRQNLRLVKENFNKKIHQEQDELLSLKEQYEKLEEERQEQKEGIEQLQQKLRRMESTFKSERETYREMIQKKKFEIEEIEQEILQLRKEEEDRTELMDTEKQIENLREEISALQKKYDQEKRHMSDLIEKTLKIVTQHKALMQRVVSKYEKKMENIVKNLREM